MMTIDWVRAYWDRCPCNLLHGTAPLGTRRYFDQVREKKYHAEPHVPPFADFRRWEGKRVLDVGCGLGTMAVDFALAGANITAVELSPRSLALARRNAESHGVDRWVEFLEANVEELSAALKPTPYDLIWSFGVLHHTPNPALALHQLTYYADAVTEMRLMLYHRLSTKAVGTALSHGWPGRTFDEAVARQSEAQGNCPITRTYTRRSARRLLESAGWRVKAMRVAHIFPYRVGPYREHRYERAFPWNILPPAWLERIFGWHLLITARLR